MLLTLANGAPVIAKRLLGEWLAHPLDAGCILRDGQRLFGKSKKVRGAIVAVLVTTAGAPLIGLDWRTGFLVGAKATLGDLVSSFTKHRLNMPSSSRATGLDQIPVSLFPVLACRAPMALSVMEVLAVVGVFLVGEMALSRILFQLRIRDRPY